MTGYYCCVLKNGVCINCGWINRFRTPDISTRRECDASRCQYLGPQDEYRDGIPYTVKCGCGKKQERTDYLPVHQCALHGRCLPNFRPTDEQREKWGPGQPIESDVQLFKWCATCPDRTPLAAPGQQNDPGPPGQ